jgi:hypothetical protein
MTGELKGSTVSVLVSEPWEFGTEHGVGPFTATVFQVNEGGDREQGVLLQLTAPLTYQGVQCEYLIASPRYAGEAIGSLITGQTLPCCLTRIPEERATGPDPFDLSAWRGGVGLLGSVARQ